MALKDNLISHWKLNESSGTRADSHGSNDLTDNNTVGVGTGKLGNGADFESTNSEYLSHADNADLDPGDTDWTFAMWVNLESTPPAGDAMAIFSKDNQLVAGRQYRLDWLQSTNRLRWFVFNSSNGVAGNAVANNLGGPSTGTWYFVVVWHSATDNQVGIQINNGTADTASTSAAAGTGTATFNLGAFETTGASSSPRYMDGIMDSVSLWHRLLTSDEKTELYNSGNGLDYDDWDVASSVSATAAVTIGGVTCSATASHTTPTYTATASPTIGGATATASATHETPTYTATASPTIAGAGATAEATHTTPTYTATASPTIGGASASASASFAAVIRSATAAVTIGGATAAASATFTSPVYTATASPTIAGATAEATATHVTPTYTATAAPTTGGATVTATAAFATSLSTATASVTTGGATVTVSATFTEGVFIAFVDTRADERIFDSRAATRVFDTRADARIFDTRAKVR